MGSAYKTNVELSIKRIGVNYIRLFFEQILKVFSTSVKCRNETYFISFLQLALLFISKFPVNLVDKN